MPVLSSFVVLLAVAGGYFGVSDARERPLPRIGVIGAGVSGSTSCYYLRQHWEHAEIDLLDYNPPGGRLATVRLGGEDYESGGSIFHPRNMYMVNFTRMFGLHPRDSTGGKMGLYDGQEMVFTGGDTGTWTAAKLLWQYGRSLIYMENYIKQILALFDRIYGEQDAGHAFTTVDRLLASMSPTFTAAMQESIKEHLTKQSYSEDFIDQLVRAGIRVNYGQTTDIHAFVALVSLAGIQPGLWSVHGGNKRIPEALTMAAKVNLLKAKVMQVSRTHGGQYQVHYQDNLGSASSKVYDVIILAAPIELSGIQFVDFPKPIFPVRGRFHRTVATFIDGKINTTKFGFDTESDFTDTLLTTNPDLFFNSIGKHHPVDFKVSDKGQKIKTVWKVFSQNPLTEAQISELFLERSAVEVVDWQAYPHYTSWHSNTKLPPFRLYENLYYSNAIEWAASAVEMVAIGGRNTALLAINEWEGRSHLTDRPPDAPSRSGNEEL